MEGDDRCVTECRPFVVGVPLTSSIALDPDPSLLQLDLPDPEQDDISTMEFLARLEPVSYTHLTLPTSTLV